MQASLILLVAMALLCSASAALQTNNAAANKEHMRLNHHHHHHTTISGRSVSNRHAARIAHFAAATNSPPSPQVPMAANGSVWPTSIWWTDVHVGTPAKAYAVAIDSGSNAFFLSGQNCSGCVTTPPNIPYVPTASSTSHPLTGNTSTFDMSYLTCNPAHPMDMCTIKGQYYSDVVSAGGYSSRRMHVGAIEEQTKNFYQFQTVDGIMGMSGGPADGNVWQTLCMSSASSGDQNQCPEAVWSLCMHEGKTSNGTMTMGWIDYSLSDGPIEFVPSPTYGGQMPNSVAVLNMSFSDKKGFDMNVSNLAFLDTGTNDIILPPAQYNATWKHICGGFSQDPAKKERCDTIFNHSLSPTDRCVHLSEEEIAAYPTIEFHLLNDVTLKLHSRDYLLLHSPAAADPATQYCPGIGYSGKSDFFIFGDTIMKSYYLVFTLTEVGWGKVNRATCGSM